MIIHDVQEWVNVPVLHPPFIIEHLLPRGASLLLHGETGVMKSWLAQHMGFSIATGTEWLGFRTTQARVLMANFEISSPTYHHRLQLMNQNFSLEHQMLFELSPSILFLEEQETFNAFRETVNGISPDVLILDCLSGCFGGDENSSMEMAKLIRNLSSIRGENRSIVVIHHSNKNYLNPSVTDRARGHSKLVGWVDTILYLVSQPTGKQLQFGKVRHAPFQIHSKNIVFDNYLWTER